jgi:uncharacterized protein YfaP (DUF2135 family)
MERTIFITLLLAAVLISGGCGSSGSSSSTTGNSSIAAGWNSGSTEYVVTDTEKNVASLTSSAVTVKSSNGTSVTIYYDSTTGLPTKAVYGNIVFVYEWDTTASTVGIAMIGSDGSIELKRDVSVSSTDITAITGLFTSESAPAKGVSKSIWTDIQADPWWYIGKAAGIVGCGAAITVAYASAGTSEFVTAGAFMGTTCGMLLVTTAYEATAASSIVDGAAGGPVGSIVSMGVDSMQCAGSMSVTDCVAAGAGIMDALTSATDTRLVQVASEVTSATASLKGGGGAVKVTLSWESAVDIDLHVTDPNSEEIYYSHTTSASGGTLDVDDRDGGTALVPAVENIFWDTNAPSGTYTVTVVYYSGSVSSVAYSVAVYKDDVLYGAIHEGTLASANPSNKVAVTTFTYP